MDDYRTAALDARTRLLLDYAVQLTRDAHGVKDETVDALGVEPEDFMGPAPPAFGASPP